MSKSLWSFFFREIIFKGLPSKNTKINNKKIHITLTLVKEKLTLPKKSFKKGTGSNCSKGLNTGINMLN